MLKSVGKTQRNNPITIRNTVITMYPISELKKLLISFKNNANMNLAYLAKEPQK